MFRPAGIGPGYFPKVTGVVRLPGKSRMDISWAKRDTQESQALPRSLDFSCRQREACGGVKMEMIHTSVLFRNTRLYSGKCNEFQWASTNPRTQPHPQWASTSPRMPCPIALGIPGPTARDPRTQFCPPVGRHQPQNHLSLQPAVSGPSPPTGRPTLAPILAWTPQPASSSMGQPRDTTNPPTSCMRNQPHPLAGQH